MEWMPMFGKWEDIETAPEDEDVLVCLPRHGVAEHSFPEMAVATLWNGEWWSDSPHDEKPEYKLHAPTHWMPLPEPPK